MKMESSCFNTKPEKDIKFLKKIEKKTSLNVSHYPVNIGRKFIPNHGKKLSHEKFLK